MRDLSARPVTGFTFKDDRTTLLCIHLCQRIALRLSHPIEELEAWLSQVKRLVSQR